MTAAWNNDPLILLCLLLAAFVYTRGSITLAQRSAKPMHLWQTAAFFGGILALFVALISPLDSLSDQLFSAHMVQHVLLFLIAPLLLVASKPPVLLLWGIPLNWRLRLGRVQHWIHPAWEKLTAPGILWLLHAGLMWLWHIPILYQAALHNDLIHVLEHISFFGSALLYWWQIFYPRGSRNYAYGISILSVFTMMLQSGILGALLTFSVQSWYPAYRTSTPAWGITALQDQQLAGVIMWGPTGLVYAGAALTLFGIWLSLMDKSAIRSK
jgi:putative membrane protein